jgi:hypothetical protein
MVLVKIIENQMTWRSPPLGHSQAFCSGRAESAECARVPGDAQNFKMVWRASWRQKIRF